MSRKFFKSGFKMFDAVALSADRTSEVTNVEGSDKASILLEWSSGSTPIGTIEVQARNSQDGTWYAVSMGGTISISGSSGSHVLVFNELPFRDIRLVYTRSSGSATLSATLAHKSVGA